MDEQYPLPQEEAYYVKQYMTTGSAFHGTTAPGHVNHGPTENELRLREAAVALTIEYFKGTGDVAFEEFDGQLTKFTKFLETGTIN